MGFFSDIIRDSQKPLPAAKSNPHGADHRSDAILKTVLQIDTRLHGLEAATLPIAKEPHEASRPTHREQDTRPKDDTPAKAAPLESVTHQVVDPSPVEPTRETGLAQANDRIKAHTQPVTGRQTGRPSRRTGAAQPSTLNAVISTASEHKDSQEAVVGAPLAQRHAPGTRETSSEPAEKITRTETVALPSQSPQNLRTPLASPPQTLSTPAEDEDGSVSAKPAPDRKRGDIASPAEAKPHPSDLKEMLPPRRATSAPSAPDLLPPAVTIPVPVEQVQPDTLPESGDDTGPPPEFRVVAALPAAPIRIETPAALAPVQNREEGRADQAPRQTVPTPDAVREGPRVQIGLLEVVVQAPASAPKGAPLANKARTNIASRHYLRNL